MREAIGISCGLYFFFFGDFEWRAERFNQRLFFTFTTLVSFASPKSYRFDRSRKFQNPFIYWYPMIAFVDLIKH